MSANGIAYAYDGSFPGLLCCIFESYTKKEIPDMLLLDDGSPSLFPVRSIPTVRENAARVWKSIRKNEEAAYWVQTGWLSCLPNIDQLLFQFIRAVFQYGPSVCKRTADPVVVPVFNAVRRTKNEAGHFLEFIRFSDYDGVLASQISPKAMVLPLIRAHFEDRLAGETFLIHDMTHQQALIHTSNQTIIRDVDEINLDAPSDTEHLYRRLWRSYYNTIAIEGRYNPKCRMTHLPKWFWANMTEFQENDKLRL